MSDTEYEAFIRKIEEEPNDSTTRLVFADWLQEQGHEKLAEVTRLGQPDEKEGVVRLERLYGKTLKSISGMHDSSDRIVLTTTDGLKFAMYHEQDCCENVSVEDVVGDVNDLIGYPLLMAEETSNRGDPPPGCPVDERYGPDSYTWTFYRFATVKGYVTVRWYGSSNGYYSEAVYFREVP